MQLFHRCSKNTCAYQLYPAVGWHRQFSLHPAIRTGASHPIPSSAWHVILAEGRLPASAGKHQFRLSLPDIYIFTVPYTGQALRLPLTNPDGKLKNHKTPPPKPQPRNTTPSHGLLDGQGPRVTYGCIPSSAPRPCEPSVRAPVLPQAAGAVGRPPPVTAPSRELSLSPPSVRPSPLTPDLAQEHAGRHGARCCPRRAAATGGTSRPLESGGAEAPSPPWLPGRRPRPRAAPPPAAGEEPAWAPSALGSHRGGMGSHRLRTYSAVLAHPLPPGMSRGDIWDWGWPVTDKPSTELCREQGKGEAKQSSCFETALLSHNGASKTALILLYCCMIIYFWEYSYAQIITASPNGLGWKGSYRLSPSSTPAKGNDNCH